ncbi:MAG: nucleoside triphosphate pyrophosphohydrolase [bacterium]|nr:nucleoside triphosphate pyrophosphohydrolase [bacterium]
MKKMKKYDKLVRDKIPDIIKRKGEKFQIKRAMPELFISKLKEKIVEEAKELKNAKTRQVELEELADLEEVIDEFRSFARFKKSQIKKERDKKAKEKGRFKKRIILIKA